MKNRALPEATWILAILAAGWLISLALIPVVSILFAALLLFTLYFFRDPERVPAGDENTAVSAADGIVTTIDEIEEKEFLKTKVRRIGIFLSVFDVHVNRSPIAGEIIHSEPKPGGFRDARDPESSIFNESRSWVISGQVGTLLVKQITGAIARRICPWSVVGDTVKRGERFGMIRFGSRTEIFLPMDAEVLVKKGDRVRGGETPVARLNPATSVGQDPS
ncbi:MAG: phosphatidylserine decarboxylase [bacterium]